MRTKNAKAITRSESEHMGRIKEMACACCGEPGPSEAHHIEQGLHYLVLPLCISCHRGQNGWHGTKAHWKVRKLTELSALNSVVAQLVS